MMDRSAMGWWRIFLDSLDTNGGHIFVLLFLMLVAYVGMRFEWANMKSGEILTGAFAALLAMLRVAGSNREQQGATTTVVASKTETGAPDAP